MNFETTKNPIFSENNIVEVVIERVLKVRRVAPVNRSDSEAFSLKAIATSGLSEELNSEETQLHSELIRVGADQMTCYAAWALFLDYKAFAGRAVN